MRTMAGVLKGDTVVLEQKEGSQLYNRGNYGYPVKRNFELDLIEAAYLVECNRLVVTDSGKDMTFEELFAYASTELEEFDIKYIVYRDIRQRGCIVKNESGPFDMSVYERGKTIMHSGKVRVFAHILEVTAAQGMAQDIQSGSQQNVFAAIPGFFSDTLSVEGGQFGVPGGREAG